MRRGLGLPESVLISGAVARVNRWIRQADRFEERLSELARARKVDGIVCGHFHRAAFHEEFGVIYANCGDWLESCTAIVEEADGQLRVVDWRGRRPMPAVEEDLMAEVEEATGLSI